MKTDSKKQTKLPRIELPDEATGLFHKNYDRILADDSLSEKDVILLAMYLLERENGKAGVDYVICKYLFTSLGRKAQPNFAVNIHNAKKKDSSNNRTQPYFFSARALSDFKICLA